jgi:hypothetical protein
MPKFSIVMPTRNRAQLLVYALQSALGQTYKDYEIIISDNDSSDDTADVVQRLGDRRVQYFRTDRCLSMPDSWEFALGKARGQWVTFLCDDDAVSPRLLERVAEVIAKSESHLVGWARACYFHHTWRDPRWRNRLMIRRFTGQVVHYDSQTQLARLFTFGKVGGLPRMLDSCCHQELIHKVRLLVGRFFLHPYPDFSSSALALSVVDQYPYLDIPLALSGEAPEGTGRSPASGLAFMQEFEGETFFQYVPLRTLVTTNGIAESLLRAKEALPIHLSRVRLNWEKYFASCYSQILGLAPSGFAPRIGDKEELLAILRKQSATLCARVYMRTMQIGLSAWLRKAILDSPVLTSLAFSMMGRRLVRGEEVGFGNSFEAARYLDTFTDGEVSRRYGQKP